MTEDQLEQGLLSWLADRRMEGMGSGLGLTRGISQAANQATR